MASSDVIEVVKGSTVDLSMSEEAEAFKQQGNAAFSQKKYDKAIDLYTQALELCPDNDVLLSNRAAAHLGKKDLKAAENDSDRAIKANSMNLKAWYRKIQSIKQAGDRKRALGIAIEAVRILSPHMSQTQLVPISKLRDALSKQGSSMKVSSSSRPSTGFLSKLNLYEDRSNATQSAIAKLRESIQSQHDIDGVFSRLCDRDSFQQMVYPGLSDKQRKKAPESFQELLSHPMYAKEIESIVPKAIEKATTVLTNVKAKGAAQGDIMDAQTEAMLWPQIVNEALARGIVDLVQQTHAQQHLEVTRDPSFIASPESEEAEWAQLDQTSIQELLCDSFFLVQDDYMGVDWGDAIKSDYERYVTNKLEPAPVLEREKEGSFGQILWVDVDDAFYESFPALSELISSFNGLPYEINKSIADSTTSEKPFTLSFPYLLLKSMGSSMAHRLLPGDKQPPRIDSITAGQQSGYRISGLYMLSSEGSPLKLNAHSSKEPKEVPWKRDRLVLWRSDVPSEREPSEVLTDSIQFWFHGFSLQEHLQRGDGTSAEQADVKPRSKAGNEAAASKQS